MTLSESIPGPAYKIITSRLVIRCLDPKDAVLLSVAVEDSLEHLLPWAPWARKEPLRLHDRIELLRKWRGDFDLGIDFEYGIFDSTERMILGATRLNATYGPQSREGNQHDLHHTIRHLQSAIHNPRDRRVCRDVCHIRS